MLKKLKSRAGLTLTELMVTMLLLTMFSSACLIGITSAFASRRDHIRIADADILKSTVTEVITQELRLCLKPVAEDSGKKISYRGGLSINGSSYDNSSLTLNDDGRLEKTIHGKNPDGTEYTATYQVLNNAAYGDDSSFGDKEYDEMGFFRIEDLSFTVDGDVISVSFNIVGKDDLKYTEADFDVVPLNTITAE